MRQGSAFQERSLHDVHVGPLDAASSVTKQFSAACSNLLPACRQFGSRPVRQGGVTAWRLAVYVHAGPSLHSRSKLHTLLELGLFWYYSSLLEARCRTSS